MNLEAVEVAEMKRGEVVELFIRSAKISQLLVALTGEVELIVEDWLQICTFLRN